ncbi:hypothetical protein ACFVUS_12665 [Nocardia sp. NPDC058058]|uniref:hypothetical protein n=1 Tax=Nocardia sp. NPDC058058 TaxID=3346317 RepID=UPI0036D98186
MVDLKSRRQVAYSMPIFMREQPPERVKWAEEVLKSRRLLDPPIPEGHIVFDPEADMARVIWNLAIAQDKTTAAIHATRYADRASVSAKRLLELEKDQ